MSSQPRKLPRVVCGHCAGAGTVDMPKHLFDVLLAVRALGRATAREVRDRLRTRVSLTAFNNRLETLRSLGLLAREPIDGRSVVYHLPRIVSKAQKTERAT